MNTTANRLKTVSADCDYANWNDEDLVTEYRSAGSRSAFDQLVVRYEKELYAYLYRFLGDGTDAEDVFQTVFIRVMERIELFDTTRKFRPWLYTVAANCARERYKRRKRFSVVSLDDECEQIKDRRRLPDEQAISAEEIRNIRKHLDDLPDDYREIIHLAYFQNLKFTEISGIVNLPRSTVADHLYKAVKLLGTYCKQ